MEIGQISGLIHDIKTVAQIVEDMVNEFEYAKQSVSSLRQLKKPPLNYNSLLIESPKNFVFKNKTAP